MVFRNLEAIGKNTHILHLSTGKCKKNITAGIIYKPLDAMTSEIQNTYVLGRHGLTLIKWSKVKPDTTKNPQLMLCCRLTVH